MIQVIETNLSIDEDDTIRDHQSRVVEVEDWDTYCKAFKEYSGEAVYFKVGLEADFMRLEYDEEQEKRLRITEIEAILNNELYENEVEEHCLDIELQFLQVMKMYTVNLMHLLDLITCHLMLYMKKKTIDILLHYTTKKGIRSCHI